MNKFDDSRQLKIAGLNDADGCEMCSCDVCQGTLPIFNNEAALADVFETQQLDEALCAGFCIGAIITALTLGGTAYSVYDSYDSPYDQDELDTATQNAYDQGQKDATASPPQPTQAQIAAQQQQAALNVNNAEDAAKLQKLKGYADKASAAAPWVAGGVGALALGKSLLGKKKKKKKKDTAEESYHYNKVVKGK